MYRALKMFGGVEGVEFRHFTTLEAAYNWLLPVNERQENEHWHIKLLPAVRREFEHMNVVTIGWNEMDDNQEIQYIQRVDAWNDDLPRF